MFKHDLDELGKIELSRKDFLIFIGIMVASLTGIVGVLEQLRSRAGTPVTSLEAEDGNRNLNAKSVTDTTASGGKAVKFTTPQGTLGTRIGFTAKPTDFDSALANTGNRLLSTRIYLTTERISTRKSQIETYLNSSPQILPVVSVKYSTQAEFTQLASDLATFSVTSRFVLAVNHEPYPDITPVAYTERYNWLCDAIAHSSNNSKVVPATIFNGWAWLPRPDRKNKLDEVYGDGTPGSGITAWHDPAMIARVDALGGIVAADFYDGGTYPTPGASPAVSLANFKKYWTGQTYTDNQGLIVLPHPYRMSRFGCGEIGSFDSANALTGMTALQDLGFSFGCWWNHDAEHMLLANTGTIATPDAPAMLSAYISTYNESLSGSALWPI